MPRKIMIIDDEPDIRIYLSAAIEDNGYEPLSVGGETSVMEMIAAEKPDLIVLDIMMPMRSGISIFKEIRTSEKLRHIPIILISGMAGPNDFMGNGFRDLIDDENISPPDRFIEKPVDIDLLIKQINTLLSCDIDDDTSR